MECQSCSDALTALIDGELSNDESRQIRDHLAVCLECESEYESLFQSSLMLERLPSIQPEDQLWARIDSDIGALPVPRRWVIPFLDQFFVRRWIPVSALGGVLVVVMTVLLWSPVDPVQDQFTHYMEEREAIYKQQRELLFSPEEVYRDREARNPFAKTVSMTESNPFQE